MNKDILLKAHFEDNNGVFTRTLEAGAMPYFKEHVVQMKEEKIAPEDLVEVKISLSENTISLLVEHVNYEECYRLDEAGGIALVHDVWVGIHESHQHLNPLSV